MKLSPLQSADYKVILPWFDDAETQRRLGGFYPLADQLKLIEDSPNKHAWLAWEAEIPVGLIELEIEGDVAYPLILVAPASRGQGFGHKLVAQLIPLASGLKAKEIEAGVSIDNTASGRCFEHAGFEIRKEVDHFNEYTFQLLTTDPDQ